MPNPLTIVGTIHSIDPSEPVSPRVAVRFAVPSMTAFLNRTHASFALHLRLLGSLRRLGYPAFVEMAPAGIPGEPTIARVLIPTISGVLAIGPDRTDGFVRVRLDNSSARHTASTASPDHAEKMATLTRALVQRDLQLFITADPDTHEILDAREAFVAFQRKRSVIEGRVTCDIKAMDATAIVDEAALLQVFKRVTLDRCTVPNPTSGCNPFLYPDDGCWARAHHVAQLLAAEQRETAKVWIYNDLKSPGCLSSHSPNVKGCTVEWDWHCATMIRVAPFDYRVIDPALFPDSPVPYTKWRDAIQGIERVCFSDSAVFKMPTPNNAGSELPNETANTLEQCRLLLDQRASGPDGPPPYSECLVQRGLKAPQASEALRAPADAAAEAERIASLEARRWRAVSRPTGGAE